MKDIFYDFRWFFLIQIQSVPSWPNSGFWVCKNFLCLDALGWPTFKGVEGLLRSVLENGRNWVVELSVQNWRLQSAELSCSEKCTQAPQHSTRTPTCYWTLWAICWTRFKLLNFSTFRSSQLSIVPHDLFRKHIDILLCFRYYQENNVFLVWSNVALLLHFVANTVAKFHKMHLYKNLNELMQSYAQNFTSTVDSFWI